MPGLGSFLEGVYSTALESLARPPPFAPPPHPSSLQRIALKPEQAIFLFVSKGTLPPTVSSLQAVYDSHQDEDGFLYMTYSGENTFGQ